MGSQFDPDLLAHGDARNVVDRYRYWSVAAIRADLHRSRSELQIAIENLDHDFNIGSIVRTANACNVAAVHIIGRRRWNRRGAMVTDAYLEIQHHPDNGSFVEWLTGSGIPLVAIDNVPGSLPLQVSRLPREVVLLFGSEGRGLSPQLLARATQILEISQFGSTRSINVGAAAAVAMYTWIGQHRAPQGGGSWQSSPG